VATQFPPLIQLPTSTPRSLGGSTAGHNDSSTIVIAEVTGSRLREVHLKGGGLPFWGSAPFKGHLHVVTTNNPGNPRSSQQVLGPQVMPADWEGFWRRTMLGKTPCAMVESGQSTDVSHPMVLWDLLEEIFNIGALLRVSWIVVTADGTEFKRVLEGRCTDFEFSPDRVTDISWKFKFDWIGRPAEDQRRVTATRDPGIAAAVAATNAAMNQLQALIEQAKLVIANRLVSRSAHPLTLGQLETLADAPNKLLTGMLRQVQSKVNDLQTISALANKVVTIPIQLASTAVNTARNITAQVNQARDLWGRTPVELNSLNNGAEQLGRSFAYFAKSHDSARGLARQSDGVADAVRRQGFRTPGQTAAGAAPRNYNAILGVHNVRAGDTPQSVSMKWYGTPEHAWDLLAANHLPLYQITLEPGSKLVVPALGTVQGST